MKVIVAMAFRPTKYGRIKPHKKFHLSGVKSNTKIATLFQILVLYCFIASFYSTGILSSGYTYSNDHRTANEERYLPIAGVDLFTNTTKPENIVVSFNTFLSFSIKNQLNDFLAYRQVTDLFLLNASSKYIFYARNTVERFEQTDIIFPFHYYW